MKQPLPTFRHKIVGAMVATMLAVCCYNSETYNDLNVVAKRSPAFFVINGRHVVCKGSTDWLSAFSFVCEKVNATYAIAPHTSVCCG